MKVIKKALNAEIIFIILAIITIVASYIFRNNSFYIISNQDKTHVINLFNIDGLNWILENVITNFNNFPVLNMVIVASLGISIAEESGFLHTLLQISLIKIPKQFLTPILLFIGIIGNIAGSIAFAIIPTLGGILFKLAKRNPILGVITGFGGVAAGLSANIFIAPTDVLVSGITESASKIIDENYKVLAISNWYFFSISTFILVIFGTLAIEYIIAPALNKYRLVENHNDTIETIDKNKLIALKYSLLGIVIFILFVLILKINILKSLIPLISLVFFIPSFVFGMKTKKINHLNDVFEMFYKGIANLTPFIILCFFASQFIGIFKKTNLGLFIAINASDYLQKLDTNYYIFLVLFLIFIVIMDLFIGSMSAKWVILAPIFVPIFMRQGFSPEFTQACYRISDSVTNAISPLEPFMPFILFCIRKYTNDINLKELIKIMLPLSIIFFVVWTIQLFLWVLFNIPLGPNSAIFLN